MKKFFNLPKLAQRLDLALEATALLRGAADVEIAGVSEEVHEQNGVTVHLITVLDAQGEATLNKPRGRYITCDLPPLSDRIALAQAAAAVAVELRRLLPPLYDRSLLVVGLGNNDATPDALGPAVAARTYATRHLCTGDQPPEGLGNVCTISPGVLGLTGLETAEIVSGVCARLQPAAVIAVDALAAAAIARVGTTVQLAETGISPGSGIGHGRTALDRVVLGCPVVAVGVPTVVDTAAIIMEALDALKEHWRVTAQILPPDIDDAACRYTEHRLLDSFGGRLVVTPKDIDQLIDDTAELIAAAIAMAVHPQCSMENYRDFIK